jgi:hypothetical protein
MFQILVNFLNTQRFRALVPAKHPLKQGSGDENRGEHIGNEADNQRYGKTLNWTCSKKEQECR